MNGGEEIEAWTMGGGKGWEGRGAMRCDWVSLGICRGTLVVGRGALRLLLRKVTKARYGLRRWV